MYKYCDVNDGYLSLHDCYAEKMRFDKGILSFELPDGFWVSKQHPQNESGNVVRTDYAQVNYHIMYEEIDGITFYIFKEGKNGKVIREEWEAENFINAVNSGSFRVEFVTQYKSFQSVLFKCWVWFEQEPYHYECEIILHTDKEEYKWNQLRYDCTW